MCTRYYLTSTPEAVAGTFGTYNAEIFPPRYNIAPAQPVLIVRVDPRKRRELALVRWGLIPSWMKDARIQGSGQLATMINARAETIQEKTSFRGPMRHRRCLVPADGFYAWSEAVSPMAAGGRGVGRQPHLVRRRDRRPLALAGLWDHWLGADGSEIETMAIITVPANATVARVQERMPAIIDERQFEAWLDVSSGLPHEAAALLQAAPDGVLEVLEVSENVNNPGNEGPEVQRIVVIDRG